MAQTLQTLSTVSFVIAGVCLVLAIFLAVFFKIPDVIGDLSGRNARKSIAKMRAANENTGTKSYRTGKINSERGKVTKTIPNPNKFKNNAPQNNFAEVETGVLGNNKVESFESEETGYIKAETTGLLVDTDATATLNNTIQKPMSRTGGKSLNILEEVLLIHTDEVIG